MLFVGKSKGITDSQSKGSGWQIRWSLWVGVICLLAMLFSPLLSPAQNVTFSAPGGFYDEPFPLQLSCPPGLSIHYTLNGNAPGPSSPVYEAPLTLDERLYSKSNIYNVQTCPDSIWFVPDSIQRCIVIRAAAFDADGKQVGDVVTQSYFIQTLWKASNGLAVISLCCDSLALFDHDTGIMVQGALRNNYGQKGKEWERLCHVEFYEPDNTGINQQAGLRVHGGYSRNGMQKGLRLYARKEYGKKRFEHKFFEAYETHSFKHLVLKPMKNGLFTDYISTQIARSLNFETTQSRPVILFLNGEYWGLYFLKERPDSQFITDRYGYNKEDVNVIESWEGEVTDGNNENFIKMMRWFLRADLSQPEQYAEACRLIDINCFIDYYCFQLFTANIDWPNYNMRCWQANNGKWRWVFFDGDYCMSSFQNIIYKTLYSNENRDISTLFFTKLLMNEDFRDSFYERYGYLLTHEFDYKNTKELFSACVETFTPEIDAHCTRFSPQSLAEVQFGILEPQQGFDSWCRYLDKFLSIRTVGAAAMVYQLYYLNDWRYNKSKAPRQASFKFKSGKPVFLFRMALQFRDWRYVEQYYAYKRYLKQSGSTPSKFKKTWLWRKLRSLKPA